MKYRVLTLVILFFVLCYFWKVQNVPNIHGIEAFLAINYASFGFSSMRAIVLFYIIPFILFYTEYSLKNADYVVVRYPNRMSVLWNESKIILLTSILFSTILTLVNIIMSLQYFSFSFLRDMNYFYFNFLNLINVFVFYAAVAIIFKTIKDITNKINLSIALTFFIYFALYIIAISFPAIPSIFNLYTYMSILDNLVNGYGNIFDAYMNFVKLAFVFLSLVIINSYIFLKKDFLNGET